MISFKNSDYLYSYNKMGAYNFPPHTHKYYEIMYFIKADGRFIVETTEYPMCDGDIIVTRPGEVHSIECREGSSYERHFVQISPQYLKYSGVNLLFLSGNRISGEYNRLDAELVREFSIAEFFEKIPYYIVNRLPESDIMVKTYIIQLMVQINNAYKKLSKNSRTAGGTDKKISAVIEYIDNNLLSDLSLSSICEKFYINKYHLCHIFKEATGYTIHEFINIRRISLAKSMLLDNKSPKETCFDCGFNEYSVFYKTFKKHTGLSPSRFRASIE